MCAWRTFNRAQASLKCVGDEDLAVVHVDLVRQAVAQHRPLEGLFQLELALGEEEGGVGHQAGGIIDEGDEVGAAHLPRVARDRADTGHT